MNTFFKNRNRLLPLIIAFFLCIPLLQSCKKGEAGKAAPKKKAEGIHESAERGPARVTLDVDKKQITIAQRINLTISVEIDEDYEVELPSFGDKLEQFGIVDYHNSQPELMDNNRKLIKRTYVLEPFLSGDYKIAPMKITFFKKGQAKDDKHFVETPGITIKVTSMLPRDMKKLKLNGIVPPLPYPQSYRIWIYAGAGLLVIALLAGGFIYYRKRSFATDVAGVRLKAHEIAYMELKALVDENLIDKDIKQFYLRLSAVVRRYIENRFGLRAPEQTTEEFLTGLERAEYFPAEYKPLLKNFLRHCDLVKFARFEPGTEEIQKSFDSCKAFIRGTEEQD